MKSILRLVVVVALAGGLYAGCGDDPLTYSAPVGIVLNVKSGDVDNGQLTNEKNINTESGNPYGAFVADASTALEDHDPSRIDVQALELTLGAGSTGVTGIGEIFQGELAVAFVMNSTDTVVAVGSGTIATPDGVGPIAIDADFDSGMLDEDDYASLLGGSFKVTLTGTAAAGFATASADTNVLVTLTFGAYE